MSKTFYHPDRGTWLTTGTPSQQILDAYPSGTIEISAAPSADHVWDGAAWAYVAPPAPTAEEVRVEAQRRLKLIAVPYEDGERETFATQEQEALAWDADNTVATPMLSAMTAFTGEAMADLVPRVLANAAALKAASGAIIGAQRAILTLDPIPADYANDSRWPTSPGGQS